MAALLTISMAAATLVALSGSASAASEIDGLASAIEAAPAMLGEDIVVPLSHSGGATAVAEDGTRVTTPERADEAVAVQMASGLTLDISLPSDGVKGAEVPAATISDDGLVVYPGIQPATSAAIQTTDEGTVRLLTVLSAAHAPSKFRYDFALPPGTSWAPTADGGLTLLDQYGDGLPLTIDPAWAVDANGQALATSYEVEGTTIVQSVEHSNAAYPVVADPAVRTVCGTWTCSLYFSRATTRAMVTPTGAAAILVAYVPVVGPVLAGAAGLIALKASEAAGLNACLRIRYTRYGPLVIVGLYSDTSQYCSDT